MKSIGSTGSRGTASPHPSCHRVAPGEVLLHRPFGRVRGAAPAARLAVPRRSMRRVDAGASAASALRRPATSFARAARAAARSAQFVDSARPAGRRPMAAVDCYLRHARDRGGDGGAGGGGGARSRARREAASGDARRHGGRRREAAHRGREAEGEGGAGAVRRAGVLGARVAEERDDRRGRVRRLPGG